MWSTVGLKSCVSALFRGAVKGGDDGNNAGSKNIAIGISSMEAFNGGTGNVHDDTRFDKNIALGYNSFRGADFNGFGRVVTDNIAIGDEALNSTGANNMIGTIAIGSNALTALTSGAGNTAVGYQAGTAITTGGANTLLGYNTGNSITEGNYNIGIGREALQNNNTDSQNIGIGYRANSEITGDRNIGIGHYAGHNSDGNTYEHSIAIGDYALDATKTGNITGTIGIGYQALTALTSGTGNSAVGYLAGSTLSTGNNNTLLGYHTGKDLTHSNNVAIGTVAFDTASSAEDSVIIGYSAGTAITTGDGNVAIGHEASSTLTTGSNNTIIGRTANVSASGATNQIAIGQGATGVQDNSAIIGNSSCADVFMGDNGSAWSTTSDGRLKENVEDWNVGLDAINNLRIVSYNFKKDNPYKYNSDKKRQGIIAQEAQKVLPEMIKDDGEWLSANQEPMIWALVNAVQELSAEVKQLKQQLEDK